MQTPADGRDRMEGLELWVMQRSEFHAANTETKRVQPGEAWCQLVSVHPLTACSGGGSSSSGGRGWGPGRVGERGGGAKPYVGGARESFGGSGVIVLADDGWLAAQGAGHCRLARLEGIDHIHLKRGGGKATVLDQQREGARRQVRKQGGRRHLKRG